MQATARRGRLGPFALVVVLLVTVLAGCTSGPDPKAAARTLARVLASGRLADVTWSAAQPSGASLNGTWHTVFAGLGDGLRPTVVATDVQRTKDTAAVRLAWTWSLGVPTTTWSYSTSATLSLVGGSWVATWSPSLLAPDLTGREALTATRLTATRGRLLGQGGTVIVEPRPVVRVGIDKTRLAATAQDAAARALAAALGWDAAAQADYAAKVAAAGPKAFVQAIVVRADDPSYNTAALGQLVGVNLVDDTLPLAPTSSFARAVLGTVGDATSEIVQSSGGAVLAGDLTGLSGLQRTYDEQLRGKPGWTVTASADGVVKRQLFHADPVPGRDLTVSLDVGLQTRAEQLLANQTSASAIIAIRPSTGELLAVASGSGGGGLSTATVGQYAPGSTFKIVSALALLRAGLTGDSTVPCPTSVTVSGKSFSNVPGYPTDKLGDISLTTAFAHSCNTAFIGQAGKVDDAALVAAGRSLGLNPDDQAGIGAFLGSVPTGQSATGHAASMIGQGQVLASPLGMATVAASVAAGRTVAPWLVEGRSAAAGATPRPTATSHAATPSPTSTATPLSTAEATTLRSMMHQVVVDGTATSALASVASGDLLAKTGTAEFTTSDGSTANHAWLVTVKGDLAVAVFVDQGDFGATTAGPIMAAFLS